MVGHFGDELLPMLSRRSLEKAGMMKPVDLSLAFLSQDEVHLSTEYLFGY